MANNSAEFPEGLLTPATLMSFFSYTYAADGKTLVYRYGHERIPRNWVRSNLSAALKAFLIFETIVQACDHEPVDHARHRRWNRAAVRRVS